MLDSFPQEAWDACEIPHPEREREKALAAEEATKSQAAQDAIAQIKGIGTILQDKHRGTTMTFQDGMDMDDDCNNIEEEQAIAWLARESGWSVLDVEEVREIFQLHAPVDGHLTINNP